MQHSRRWLGTVVLLFLALIAGFVAGVGFDRFAANPASIPLSSSGQPGSLDYNLINQALRTVDRQYVDRPAIVSKTLTYGAISGMVDSLGDTGHSRFLTPADVREESSMTTGAFEGIGAEVVQKDGRVVVVTPLDGSPAQKAGIKPGDVMLQVNGKSVEGQTLQEVVSQVLGPAGTTVRITILTPKTNQTREVTLVRARITLRNVTWQTLPGTALAHIRIAEFSNGVSRDLAQAIQQAQAQQVTGIVLDLRNDPGGLLNEAVATASDFITRGNVLLEKDAQGKVTPVKVEPSSVSVSLPMVVLINEGTASASEIVAGAIQDAKRALLVGATTFGTGTVLNEFPLSDGSALLLATEEWLTPSGRVIWHQGIVPDQAVALPLDASVLVPEAEQQLTSGQLQTSGDTQLLRAISILSGQPQK
ncbi:MAG: S41 family peptidase [Chloroflexi bacterium]|nr:S41 family peptidase [Chloroflexota bacterium]